MKKFLIFFIDALLFLISLVGLYQTEQKAGLPAKFQSNSLIISEFLNSNHPSALKPNDILVSVDNIHLNSFEDLEFILDGKKANDKVLVTTKRGNEILLFTIRLVPFYSLRYLIIQFLVGAFFFAIAIFVLLKQFQNRGAHAFHWVMVFSALIIFNTWGNYTINPPGAGQFIRCVFSIAYAFTAVIFFHFTSLFPFEKNNLFKNVLKLLYLIASLLSLIMIFQFMHAVQDYNVEEFRNFNTTFNFCRLLFAVCILISIINFFHSYKTAKEEMERRKLRWILLGLAIGPICLVFLWIIPQIITSQGLIDEEFVVLAMLSIPITSTIAIVKYHLLDIDQIFKRSTVYAVIIFFVLFIYITMVVIISWILGSLTVTSSLTASALSAILTVSVYQPLTNWIHSFVDRKFFNVRYNFRNAEIEFIEKTKYCFDEMSLMRTVFESIEINIPTVKKDLFLFANNQPILENIKNELVSNFTKSDLPLFKNEHVEMGAKCNSVNLESISTYGYVATFKIFSETDGLSGALLLGEKKSGFRFNIEDIDLLKSYCHNISLTLDRIKLQNKLMNEQNESRRLKELNELKSYFVSSVSHELKTPLTSIKLFAEIIEDNPNINKNKQAEYLDIIKGESDRLTRLIDNVLNVSKIEKGIKVYRISKVELNEIAKKVMKSLTYDLKKNNFKHSIKLFKEKLFINADKDAIGEILINLISNSIKYSDEKKFICVKTETSKNKAVLSVEDKGIGISEENISKIFQPYERVHSEKVMQKTGTGLGLALVKHIADAHGAGIKVKSKLGQGTVFSITFKLINKKTLGSSNEKNSNN